MFKLALALMLVASTAQARHGGDTHTAQGLFCNTLEQAEQTLDFYLERITQDEALLMMNQDGTQCSVARTILLQLKDARLIHRRTVSDFYGEKDKVFYTYEAQMVGIIFPDGQSQAVDNPATVFFWTHEPVELVEKPRGA